MSLTKSITFKTQESYVKSSINVRAFDKIFLSITPENVTRPVHSVGAFKETKVSVVLLFLLALNMSEYLKKL